jgi:hypothetical protein
MRSWKGVHMMNTDRDDSWNTAAEAKRCTAYSLLVASTTLPCKPDGNEAAAAPLSQTAADFRCMPHPRFNAYLSASPRAFN